jgi:opacity protein-like surface antigen
MRHLRAFAVLVLALTFIAGGAYAAKPLSFYAGAGFNKCINDNAPSGSIGLMGGLIYQLKAPFAVGGEVGYMLLGKETNSVSGLFGANYESKATWSTIPVTAQGYYLFPASGSALPYVTAGLGFYATKIKVEYSGNYEGYSVGQSVSNTNTDIGLNLGGGAKFGGSDAGVKFGIDGRFHIIMTDVESTKVIAAAAKAYF